MKTRLDKLNTADWTLELRPLDAFVVSRYRQAMRVGEEFPPLIIDKDTREIISGNHRAAAAKAEFGDSHAIEVSMRKFTSHADKLKVMAEENSKHGIPMSGITRRRMTCAMISEGMSTQEIATILGFPVKSIEKWGGISVVVKGKGGGVKPVKRSIDTEKVQSMTQAQYTEHSKADVGIEDRHMAQQLSRHLRSGWVNLENEENREAFLELKQAMEEAGI